MVKEKRILLQIQGKATTTVSGENRANRYKGLDNIEIIKIYSKGG